MQTTLYFQACAEHPANTYDDAVDCAVTCATSGWPLGTVVQEGSIECRRSHAGLAVSTGDLDPHCFHSPEVPTKGACEVIP
jgi:hypothetical protein